MINRHQGRAQPLTFGNKMIRFFADPSEIKDSLISLSAEDATHIKSLRMRPAELFVVCDGQGTDHVCRLSERGGGTVAEIVETKPSLGEPDVACSVFIAIAKGDRLDYAVQKSVELGSYEIFLFPSERCVSVPGDMSKKIARLQRIALRPQSNAEEAACRKWRQYQRLRLPSVKLRAQGCRCSFMNARGRHT